MNSIELFTTAIDSLTSYQQDNRLSSSQMTILKEVIARLKNLKDEYALIIQMNNELLKEDPGLVAIKKKLTDENIIKMLTETAKNDTKLSEWLQSSGGALKRDGISEIASYDMSDLESRPEINIQKIQLLHSKTESLYHNLWNIIRRVEGLPKFEKFKPKGANLVRNHLIEYSHRPTNGAHIYSFGISTNGPVLRPTKPVGAPAINDKGLIANVEEFLLSIIKRIK